MFWSRKGHFSNYFFLGNISQENILYDLLEPKKAFPGNKNKKYKKSKYCDFSKGVNPMVLVQKWPFFQLFFLGNISQENVLYYLLEQKNAILGNKNKKLKKSKNWHFFKGVNTWFYSKNGDFCNFFFLGNISQENVLYDLLEQKKSLSWL